MTIAAKLTRIRGRPRTAADATRSWPAREGLAFVLFDGELEAYAEIAPLPGVSPDHLEDAARALAATPWHKIDPRTEDPLSIAERLVPVELPSARLALETALLDLAGRRAGLPVASLITDKQPAAAVATAALLTELEGALERAERAVEQGARALKIKIGRKGRTENEIAILRALRRKLGDGIAIRADANGTLENGSHPLIAVLAEIGAEWVEDPFSAERLLSVEALPLPVAIDEALWRDPASALRAIDRGRATVAVLKPPLLGGLGRALALAKAVSERGARAVVSHLYDPPAIFTACAHLALALGDHEVHGLGRYDGIDSWLDDAGDTIAVPTWIGSHRIVLPTGLGGLR